MGVADLTIAVTAAALAAAALIFAFIQTTSALATFLNSSNRCGRSITGAFDLADGIWFSIRTLTAHPRYRMPVLTIHDLRVRTPSMGVPGSPTNHVRLGRNFEKKTNCYRDGERVRVYGLDDGREGKLILWKTVLHYVLAIIWAPFGLLATLAVWIPCCPCCMCFLVCAGIHSVTKGDKSSDDPGGCGGVCDSTECVKAGVAPIRVPFRHMKHYTKTAKTEISDSETPGLEPGSWVQFLVNHQGAWWGFADLRWEWRLASTIPTDVYGASMETSVADVQLMAARAGMEYSEDPHLLATTRCGEQLSLSRHNTLGVVAYYRSTRENIRTSITHSYPENASEWLHRCIEACRYGQSHLYAARPHYSHVDYHVPPEVKNLDKIIIQLARQRTIFDAQLPFSCGNAMWIFDTPSFRTVLENLNGLRVDSTSWEPLTMGVLWGPLGQGINACSCSRCRDEWELPLKRTNDFPAIEADYKPDLLQWPALALKIMVSKSQSNKKILVAGCETKWLDSFEDVESTLNGAKVVVQLAPLCYSNKCTSQQPCRCGQIARLSDFPRDVKHKSCVLAVVAINTKWLSRARHELLEAAEALLARDIDLFPDKIKSVARVLAYTEFLLLHVRESIGASNIWNSPPTPTLRDFSSLVLGS